MDHPHVVVLNPRCIMQLQNAAVQYHVQQQAKADALLILYVMLDRTFLLQLGLMGDRASTADV